MEWTRTWFRFFEHLRRIPRTRGFGVQSPTAYSFLRNVVNESQFLSLHACEEKLLAAYPHKGARRERFLFRLRYCYPLMTVIDMRQSFDEFRLDSMVATAKEDFVLVVLHPNADRETAQKWEALVRDKRCVLTFDMIDCGVVFFDPTKYKQHFKVNY